MSKRAISFLVFFSIVLSLYTLLNAYLFWRGWGLVPEEYRMLYAFLYGCIAYAFIVGRFLERIMLNWFTTALVFIGAYWLGAMVYGVLLFLCLDILRVFVMLLPVIPPLDALQGWTTGSGFLVVGIVAVLLVVGSVNARRIHIKRLELHVRKNVGHPSPLTIAVASDIHLGTIICRKRIEKIVEKLNALNADVVLLPGDVVDEDLAPVIRQNLGEVLRAIKARYGVFAVTGNHEYIGGVEAAVRYLRDHGITVLRDEVATVAGRFTLVGREDLTSNRFGGSRRKPLPDLMQGVDTSLPVILLDHQPFRLHEAESNGVDLQLSGHTHNGQLWPFNYITRRVYEVSWGYAQKGNTHYYISSGVGTWGPPLKLGNHAEIVHITISFT